MKPIQAQTLNTEEGLVAELQRLTRENAELHDQLERAANREAELRASSALLALDKEQLRINEERWNLALQGAGDGVWDWDATSNRIILSERSRELMGVDGEVIASEDFLASVIHPEDVPRRLEALERPLRGETDVFSTEVRFRTRDGNYRWILSSGRVIDRNAEGKPLRIVGTHKDIEERRRVRQALKNREALLREFIVHTPAAIAILDRDMCYLQASRRWLIDYNLQGQEIVGRSHYEVFPDIPERWKEVHRRALAGAAQSCEEDPFARADGSMEWLKWEVRPWHDTDGAIGGLIFFTQVITERKELGLRLAEQNLQLSRSNAELEQFAYVASHDLQEPLRAIAGCTHILAQRYKGHLDSQADTLVAHIVEGSARMKALIDGLLSLSRVSSEGGLDESVDVGQILVQVLRNLDASIQSERAQVKVGPMPHVRGEPTQLLQLFQNLVGNALKYHRAEPPEVHITAAPCNEGFQFSIRDNGIGIAADYFERIFGVFQRLHTRDEYPGTGIGLAICRKTVQRHGGRIWLESGEGLGTTFHFTLPV